MARGGGAVQPVRGVGCVRSSGTHLHVTSAVLLVFIASHVPDAAPMLASRSKACSLTRRARSACVPPDGIALVLALIAAPAAVPPVFTAAVAIAHLLRYAKEAISRHGVWKGADWRWLGSGAVIRSERRATTRCPDMDRRTSIAPCWRSRCLRAVPLRSSRSTRRSRSAREAGLGGRHPLQPRRRHGHDDRLRSRCAVRAGVPHGLGAPAPVAIAEDLGHRDRPVPRDVHATAAPPRVVRVRQLRRRARQEPLRGVPLAPPEARRRGAPTATVSRSAASRPSRSTSVRRSRRVLLANVTYEVAESTDAAGAIRALTYVTRDSERLLCSARRGACARTSYLLDLEVETQRVPDAWRVSDYLMTFRSWPLLTEANPANDLRGLRGVSLVGKGPAPRRGGRPDRQVGEAARRCRALGRRAEPLLHGHRRHARRRRPLGHRRGREPHADRRQLEHLPQGTKPAQPMAIGTLVMPLPSSGSGVQRFMAYLGPADYFALAKEGGAVQLERAVDMGWNWIVPVSKLLLQLPGGGLRGPQLRLDDPDPGDARSASPCIR